MVPSTVLGSMDSGPPREWQEGVEKFSHFQANRKEKLREEEGSDGTVTV